MIIVVDAYNLLRTIPPYKKTITDQERVKFIAQLGSYGRRKGHKMIIVFDGGAHEWPFKETIKGMLIVYSGIHESADDYIKEYLELHKAQDLLLVSSDTELNDAAAHLSIPSIKALHFYYLVREELLMKKSSTVQHNTEITLLHDNESEIDALMTQASKHVSTKSEDLVPMGKKRDASKTALSKQERALLKKLHKL